MDPEKVTVTVGSSVGEDALLTVEDAMHQVLDLFSLLTLAGGEEAKEISWQLVAVSMNSPLQVTAQAVAVRQGVLVEAIAFREKITLARGLSSLAFDSTVPAWMNKRARDKTRALLSRNLNGIGITDLRLDEIGPNFAIRPFEARRALEAINNHEKRLADADDLSRTEYGSIEATVLDTTTFRNHPALRMKNWLGGYEIHCVFSDEVAHRIGPQKTWSETWAHQRFIISGEISYRRDGRVSHVYAQDLEPVAFSALKYEDIADPDFTNGINVADYVDIAREREGG